LIANLAVFGDSILCALESLHIDYSMIDHATICKYQFLPSSLPVDMDESSHTMQRYPPPDVDSEAQVSERRVS
jgi:hypothetical protein